jgi:F0F1-type ATP synthase membrane subunit c/vacuolar-type H+-ATPase subunit K
MNIGRNDCQRISRRAALTGTALALGTAAAATAVTQAMAQVKISQATAKYQNTPKGNQRCNRCVNFQSPSACKFVQGNISPSGWCQLLAPKA